ncbi:unnamed protein product [Sordaria macrospora k-hell]|uniref:WGS project CABT00000000 data, contig 2.44 n=1 Tax=Sordaria macrospora (strain ATCC MYA-333 / DSM 997 / K(L3346) / K-hell) TaxID=771870 RepID=F7W8F1_SORMK|nr:uncharacterized protein SMAC_07305 [Sordaria macrospora k-hell]CCC13796.1 unnamed protein product [Sordaria macrospora k-hell]
MAPRTNAITTAITDAPQPALTVPNPTSTVNINMTNIINSPVQFSASWSNIFLGVGGIVGLIIFICWFISQKAWNHGWWPKGLKDKLLDTAVELLRVMERMENGIDTIVTAQQYHFDCQESQMDRLLQLRGAKDRRCLHRDEEPCGPRCSSSSSATAWGEGWGMGQGSDSFQISILVRRPNSQTMASNTTTNPTNPGQTINMDVQVRDPDLNPYAQQIYIAITVIGWFIVYFLYAI